MLLLLLLLLLLQWFCYSKNTCYHIPSSVKIFINVFLLFCILFAYFSHVVHSPWIYSIMKNGSPTQQQWNFLPQAQENGRTSSYWFVYSSFCLHCCLGKMFSNLGMVKTPKRSSLLEGHQWRVRRWRRQWNRLLLLCNENLFKH